MTGDPVPYGPWWTIQPQPVQYAMQRDPTHVEELVTALHALGHKDNFLRDWAPGAVVDASKKILEDLLISLGIEGE